MKKYILVTLILGSFFISTAWALIIIEKGIYGDDNRRATTEINTELEKSEANITQAIFAQIPRWRITSEDNNQIVIKTKSLMSGLNFCADEKFSELPIVSSCSAFLVGEDLILTAGHCLKDKYECQKNYWVLDYNDKAGFLNHEGQVVFNKEQVYSCAQIISESTGTKLDYALIKLNRKVEGRRPLNIRRNGQVSLTDQLFIVGHPLGLPKIIADDIKVRSSTLPHTFVTNADAFSGNSGSPVINRDTFIVEGILIRGDTDFEMDIAQSCNRVYRCQNNDCRGETVLRTTSLPLKLIPKI